MSIEAFLERLKDEITPELGQLALDIGSATLRGEESRAQTLSQCHQWLVEVALKAREFAEKFDKLQGNKGKDPIDEGTSDQGGDNPPPPPPPLPPLPLRLGGFTANPSWNQVEQMVWLVKQVGLRRVYAICRAHSIMGCASYGQLFVDVEWRVPSAVRLNMKRCKEDGRWFYIYANLNLVSKIALLEEVGRYLSVRGR